MDLLEESYEDFICDYVRNAEELKKSLFSLDESFTKYQNDDTAKIMAELFLKSLSVSNIVENTKEVVLYKNGKNKIQVIEGDIFRYCFGRSAKSNIVVIPVNTTFETEVTYKLHNVANPLVSNQTLHGMFIERWINAGESVDELENAIAKNLKLRGIKPIKNNNGKNEFAPGTIAIIDSNGVFVFLVAVSEFDEKNVAHSSKEILEKSIQNLVELYDTNGLGYKLYLPLIGTGRSRTNLNSFEAYQIIKDALINQRYLYGEITLVLTKETYEEIKEGGF